ncbi:MAG: hmsH [Burkholderia sp.]|nr:hmsH [Burkholderia sp.]
MALTASPDDAEAHAGLAYAWMDQGRIDQAVNHLTARLPKTPTRRDLPVLIALAELQDRRGEWLLAAGAYQDALKLEPGFRYAARGRVFALNNAGLPHLAKRLAESRPDAFNDEEMRRLTHDAAARTIIFGQAHLAADEKPPRFGTTDIALLQNAEVSRRFGDKPITQFDRLVALRDRYRMREAVDLYESLAASNITIPSYANAAAADAYLYLEQPDRARELYLEALKDAGQLETTEWMETQVALMYANSEAGRHEEAQVLADQVLHATPPMSNKGLLGMESPNAHYPRAALMVSLMLMYADRLEQAEQGLSEQRALAPFNSGIRSAWASLHTMRARPRAALEEFALLQEDEPKSVDAAVGRADTMLSLNQFGDARTAVTMLLADYPENKAVQNLAHRLEQHDRLQLKIDMTIGHGGSAAAAESVLDTTLHSAPLKNSLGEHFRVFSHLSRSRGETGEALVSRTRAGAGVGYRARDIVIEAEINRAAGAANANGVALAMTKSLSDAWHVHAVLDTNLNDLPAAAFHNGVTAGALKTGVTWVRHESRKAGGELSQTRFSDENRRNAARLWWTERWISGPAVKVESSLQLYGSTNNLRNAAYFNPERDREASLSLSGEWLTWRRYHRSFRQRLSYTAGRYWQDDFAVAGLGDVRYEHEWRDDRHFSFRYGLGRGFHPYDGMREDRNYGFATFYWEIK